ncbi:MAG: plasmid pRiA4b ORF-3 family protein [Vicinamibacterales bacterium]
MARAKRSKKKVSSVCQLLVVLPRTDPLVWRRIQVPESYSFWDLHVAVQDAMGWLDYHLHEFEFVDKDGDMHRIGLPDEDMFDERVSEPGWEVPMARFLTYGSAPVRYRYDFGDDWEHTIEFEDVLTADEGIYPRCVAGAGACPPEDVGGTDGYAEFLRIIGDRRHPERRERLDWVGGAFDAFAFDPSAVTFDDPKARLTRALADRDGGP